MTVFGDAESDPNRSSRILYRLSYGHRSNEGEAVDVFVIFEKRSDHVLPHAGSAEKRVEQGLTLVGHSADGPEVLTTVAGNWRCRAIECRQRASVRRCDLEQLIPRRLRLASLESFKSRRRSALGP